MDPWLLNVFASLGAIGFSYWWYIEAIKVPTLAIGLVSFFTAIALLYKVWSPYAF